MTSKAIRGRDDGGWDIGPYEYQGTVVAPVADFVAEQTWGVPPAVIFFTDETTGGPTSWSWNFGDGNTSTSRARRTPTRALD